MPKSFLFTHRRYVASPIPPDESSSVSSSAGNEGPKYPPARLHQPVSLMMSSNKAAISSIPEEMYNLFQLAEVSLAAASSNGTSRPGIDRWRSLKHVNMDKPLDLSRSETSTASVNGGQQAPRILTPSPSPTPSESHMMTLNLGLRKTNNSGNNEDSSSSLLLLSDESDPEEDSSSCCSPDDSTSCRSIQVGKASSSTGSNSDNNSHSGDGHECPDCGKRYSTSSNLARHRQTHRSPADQKARRCPHCDKVYVSVPAFSMHVRTHSQGCKCPYCGKSFSRPWLLQGHIRTHTGEKPFSCQICDKAFADKSNLRAHIQTHSNLKPFTCQRCGKAFALKSYLYKHEESSCMKMVTKMPKDDE